MLKSKESNSQMTRRTQITESSKDLADTEVEKFKELTADVDFTDENSFREKIDTLKENYFPKTNPLNLHLVMKKRKLNFRRKY